MQRRGVGLLVIAAMIGVACSSGGDGPVASNGDAPATVGTPAPSDAPTSEPPVPEPAASGSTDPGETSPPASEPAPPPATEPVVEGSGVRDLVTALASDELAGRNNQTEGSARSRDVLVAELAAFTSPLSETGDHFQGFDLGVNLIGIIPGGELADEYMMIGAHYDHLGPGECDLGTDEDDICNGATDNATGVVAALTVARSIAAAGTPRRSVIVALWDAEEDGLAGSAHYVANPIVPLAQTVAYINFDIQGATLLPTLATTTFMIGAETGGQALVDAATAATAASSLDTVAFSVVFGQGRSDHASLVAGGVPSVFFSDSNSGCYHTVKDDIDAVDFDKLDQQIRTATALATDLVSTDTPPALDAGAPLSSYDDAVGLLDLARRAEPDFGLFEPDLAAAFAGAIAEVDAVVTAGPDAYDDAAATAVLNAAGLFVEALFFTDCPAG